MRISSAACVSEPVTSSTARALRVGRAMRKTTSRAWPSSSSIASLPSMSLTLRSSSPTNMKLPPDKAPPDSKQLQQSQRGCAQQADCWGSHRLARNLDRRRHLTCVTAV
eukprot:CAMPEP_0181508776 /NCGR_PEP_ID=MMETSP1110-20121109/59951_1 /TAXON_ID=174948 /ORGANISM="Symbiodinium sp., Strain CCMP421" /LENGTH=108 /DNA_ID=CAMNT_0023638209 /DNA_START=1008 /DNA_END=1335 /DNA_ORIENTATION=-